MQEVAAPLLLSCCYLVVVEHQVVVEQSLDVILMCFAAQNLIKPNIRTGTAKNEKPAPVTVRVGMLAFVSSLAAVWIQGVRQKR